MIQAIVEEVIEFVPRVIGWAFLKLVTLGRYRGFRNDDLLIEGGLDLGLIDVGPQPQHGAEPNERRTS